MPHPATRRTDLTPNGFSSNDRAIVCRRRPPRNSADVAHSLHFPYESILNFVLSRFLLSSAACNYFTFSFPNDSSNLQLFASRRIVSLLVSAKRKIIVNNLLITNFNDTIEYPNRRKYVASALDPKDYLVEVMKGRTVNSDSLGWKELGGTSLAFTV